MFLNSVGMMGEVVVLGWLSLELTNSPFLVGVAMGMRALPSSSSARRPAPWPIASRGADS